MRTIPCPLQTLSLFIALVAILAAGCSAPPAGTASDAASAAGKTSPFATAHEARTASGIVGHVESLLADYPIDGPGAVVLVKRGDEVLYRGGRGLANVELGVPLSPDHVFRIGSVSKQFGAAAVLKLADEGKLALDDPLSRFLPDYPGAANITLAQLLNHTAGIRNYTAMRETGQKTRMDVDIATKIGYFRDAPVDFAPGQGWNYSNSGYILVGAVIEQASGQSWDTYVQQVLLDPAGLRHTGYGNAADGVIAGHVSGYDHDRDTGRTVAAELFSMTQPNVAGALVSNVDDMARWNEMLHQGRLLQADSYRRMTTPQGKAAEQDVPYGLGLEILQVAGQPVIRHDGGIPGFTSYNAYLPKTRTSIVVLRNASSSPRGVPSASRLGEKLTEHLANAALEPLDE